MNAGAIPATGEVQERAAEAIDKLLRLWNDQVMEFVRQLYRATTLQEPSSEALAKLQADCKFMLRVTNLIAVLAKDPDFPPCKYRQEIPGKVQQLEEWLAILQNPMTDQEAEELLQKCFPDDSRAGTPA